MNDTERIEGPLLRVPFESLKRVSRDRKYVIDEITSVLDTIGAANHPQIGKQEAIATLEHLVDRLQGLKRKVVFMRSVLLHNATLSPKHGCPS